MIPLTCHNLPGAACQLPAAAYCHICQSISPTVYLHLGSGHLGNCCGVCRATRKGHPFISRRELTTNAGETGHRGTHEISIRKG